MRLRPARSPTPQTLDRTHAFMPVLNRFEPTVNRPADTAAGLSATAASASPPWIQRLSLLVCSMLALGALLGCVSEGKQPPRPASLSDSGGGPIDQINLLAYPVAIDVDQTPGPDGFALKVYANTRRSAKPIPIEAGKIEIFMFDNALDRSSLAQTKPLRVWTFTSDQLRGFEIHTSIGVGYQLAPLWDKSRPLNDKFTIVVRDTAPTGQTVTSEPSIIAVGVR